MRPAAPFACAFLAAVSVALATFAPVCAVAAPGAATGTLRVTALDADTLEPVAWANLVSLDGTHGYLADADGRFEVELPPGLAQLRVVHVSYGNSPEIRVEITPGSLQERTVFLMPRAHEVSSLKVQADRVESPARRAEGIRSVRVRNATALPNPTDDIFRTLRVLPGVAISDVGSRFHLRGGGVDQLLVRVDGMELREFFHGQDFGGITSVIPSGAVERIDVYPAGFPARMGGRLSGAVDLELRKHHGPRGTHGTFRADVTSARALVEKSTTTGTYLVSARQSYLDRVLDSIQDDAVVQPQYRDVLIHAVHHPDAERSISVNYLRAEDNALYRDRVDTHFVDAEYVDDYLWSSFRLLPSRRFTLDGTLHRAWTHDRREFGIGGRSDESQERAGGRLQLTTAYPDHLLAIGAQVDRQWGRYSFRAAEPLPTLVEGNARTDEQAIDEGAFGRTLTAAWIQDDWRAAPSLTLHLGARYSRDSATGRDFLAPRVSAALELARVGTLRGYWGAYEQAPRLTPDSRAQEQFIADELQVAEHRGIGLERSWRSLRFGVDAYEKIFHRLDGVVTRFVYGVEERHVITHGRSHGVELSVRHAGQWSNWWAAYTLGRSDWTDGERTFSRDFDQLHALTFANTIQLDHRWDLGLSYSFHTGTPYTEQNWRRVGSSDWIVSEGLPNGARLPNYHRLDVRLRRQFAFEGWDLSVYAEALNVTNHPNVLWYGWRIYDDNGPLPQAERVTRTGIPGVPSVGMEIRF